MIKNLVLISSILLFVLHMQLLALADSHIGPGNFIEHKAFLDIAANNPPQFVDSISNVVIESMNVTTNEDVPKRVHLRIIDTDPDGIEFTSITSLGGKGIIQGASFIDTSFQYVPNPNVYGMDTVQVVIHDNGLPQLSDTLNVVITILPVNDKPIIVDGNHNQVTAVFEKVRFNVVKQICLNAYDIDTNRVVISLVLTQPKNGAVGSFRNMCFNYTPNNNFIGRDSMEILFSDNGSPIMFNSVMVYIKAYPFNSPPVILDQQGTHITSILDTTLETVPLHICLNATDPQNDSIAIHSVISLGGHIQNDSISDDSLCFNATPIGLFYGDDSIQVIVKDNGYPEMYDTLIVHLHVWHHNRPPEILNNNGIAVDTLYFDAFEDEVLPICLSIFDADNDHVIISNITTQGIQGTISVTNTDTACLEYAPPHNLGRERLIITICDNGEVSLCDSVVIIINVSARFMIGQAISPNNDGINDTWQISGIERHPNNTVTIFSRWNDLVYTIRGYDNSNVVWRGRFNDGREVPDGTYFYIIELEDGSKRSGYIVVKR